jgi:hypothetical protein
MEVDQWAVISDQCTSRYRRFSLLVTDHWSLITPQMLDLATVSREQFAACLNQDFEIVFADGTLPVKLIDAKQWGPDQPANIRQPFALTFRIQRNLRFPQGTYKMRNAELGEMEIFLVQTAGDANSSTLEAVFN